MKKIYIWGLGKGLACVKESIDWNNAELCGYIDNDSRHQGGTFESKPILSSKQMSDDYDYVIVASMLYYAEIKRQLIDEGTEEAKILLYFDMYDHNFGPQTDFINMTLRTIQLVKRMYQPVLSNLEYETAAKFRSGRYVFPIIRSSKEALQKILQEHCSICRFGDGEFEIMFGRDRPAFQKSQSSLAERLRQIINNSQETIITCIADNYGELGQYTDDVANGIRSYLSGNIRQDHMSIIDMQKIYYNAYVSRPYIIYRDKFRAKELFSMWKTIWSGRDLMVVEGELTRSGYKNDLFESAKSIQRILCPAENAWDVYSEILEYIKKNVSRKRLIIIALGPAATVLAYDLAVEGYQALDVGHIDNEYEWYLRQAELRMNIEYKYVHECGVSGRAVSDIQDDEYNGQIVKRIGV